MLTTNLSAFALSQRTEVLENLTTLPITDDSTLRMYEIRHGESTANEYFEWEGQRVRYVSGRSNHIPLTDLGKAQILQVAQKLTTRIPEQTKLVILSSSAERTKHTAKILFEEISKTHPNCIFVDEGYEGIDERSLGNWEGQIKDHRYTDAEAPWRALSAIEKFESPEVPGAETWKEVAERALPTFEMITQQYSDYTIFAVTSFNTINATAICLNDLQGRLSTESASNLPKLNLGNGDLVLIEMEADQGFKSATVTSHIQSSSSLH